MMAAVSEPHMDTSPLPSSCRLVCCHSTIASPRLPAGCLTGYLATVVAFMLVRWHEWVQACNHPPVPPLLLLLPPSLLQWASIALLLLWLLLTAAAGQMLLLLLLLLLERLKLLHKMLLLLCSCCCCCLSAGCCCCCCCCWRICCYCICNLLLLGQGRTQVWSGASTFWPRQPSSASPVFAFACLPSVYLQGAWSPGHAQAEFWVHQEWWWMASRRSRSGVCSTDLRLDTSTKGLKQVYTSTQEI